ncbi:MAG: urea carboxylase-associated family protein [Rhodospirillales bacterium]|nr:urea carboxylase-associated family protein [Rhodospirillales bacterium]
MKSIVVKGGHGGRIEAKRGQLIEITTVEESQVCDLFAFNSDNIREALSPGHTRQVKRHIYLKKGDVLYSNLRRQMFLLIDDPVGVNDLCMSQCDPERYELSYGLKNHRSCRHNLAEAMKDFGIPYEYLPEPVNIFQPTFIQADGTFAAPTQSPAKAGDTVTLRTLMDVIVAVSACPQDQTPLNKHRPSDLRITVRDV